MAKVSWRTDHEGIERMRELTEALILTEKDRAGPLRIVMHKEHARQVKQAFQTEGASTGMGKWKGWSPSYAAWRASLPGSPSGRRLGPGFGSKILVLGGEMKSKATKVSHPDFVSLFKKPFTYSFGVRDEKAVKHENGPSFGLPRRSFIQKTPGQLEHFNLELTNFWKKRIRQVLRNA